LTYSLPHSSRRDYCPRNKQEWIVAIKILYYRHGQLYAGFLQQHYPQLYHESVWLFGDWDAAMRAAGLKHRRICGYGVLG
jgi:hypothetical protein